MVKGTTFLLLLTFQVVQLHNFSEEWILEAEGNLNEKTSGEVLSYSRHRLDHGKSYLENSPKHEKPRPPLHFQSDSTCTKPKAVSEIR